MYTHIEGLYIISKSKRTAKALLLHTMDEIPFLLGASIGIELSNMSVLLTINAITFLPDLSIDTVSSDMSVVIPILEFSNAIPVIPIPSAHPMWYLNDINVSNKFTVLPHHMNLIDMFPTVPPPPPLEALLGC